MLLIRGGNMNIRNFSVKRKLVLSTFSVLILGLMVIYLNINISKPITPLNIPLPGEASEEKDFEYEIADLQQFSGQVEVYKLNSRNIDKKGFKDIAKKLSLNPSDEQIKTGEKTITYSEGDKLLLVEPTGRWIYSIRNNLDLNRKGKIKLLSDNEAKKVAKDFLESKGFLPSEFFISNVRDGLVNQYSDGTEEAVNKQVVFHRKINGKEVLGVSRIVVQVGENGIIEGVSSVYNNYSFYTKKDLKDVYKAMDELKKNKGLENFEQGKKIKKVKVNKVELVYFEQPNIFDQPYLYPVYKFTGKGIDEKGNEVNYSGIIEAIE